jgi:peroxiredoxin
MNRLLLPCVALIFLTPLLARAADQAKPLDFKYVAIDGSNVDLADMRGKVVMIFFWATWSKPSRDNVKTIVNVRKKYHDKGLEVLGVSLDSDENAMKTFTDEYSMNWPEYFDGKGDQNDVARTMGVKQIPSVWVVGKDGRVIAVNPSGSLDALVEKALKAK